MTTDPTPTSAVAWTGYTPDDLAWYAEAFRADEWMVHVVGPDDCHLRKNPDLDDDDPANPLLTEESAHDLAESFRRFNHLYAEKYPTEGSPGLIPTVFHRGVPVPVIAMRHPNGRSLTIDPATRTVRYYNEDGTGAGTDTHSPGGPADLTQQYIAHGYLVTPTTTEGA